MDRFALSALNVIVGNAFDAAGLEWALGGGILRFDSPCTCTFGGADVAATLAGKAVVPFTTLLARGGDELRVESFTRGRFLYVAFSGGIDVAQVLGSRSTYLPGHFGGLSGRMVARGDSLRFGPSPAAIPHEGFTPAAKFLPRYDTQVVRVTRGTHADWFDERNWSAFTGEQFTVSTASDRTGYKLSGARLAHTFGDLPSDPGCEGAIQIPGEGSPIVLMADAPTVGGYPKIAVVSDVDLPIIAQRTPGQQLKFAVISIEESQHALRQRISDLDAIRSAGAASA